MANKFITTDLGGLPFELDDLRFLEQAEADSILGMLSGFNQPVSIPNSYILSGAVVTDSGANLDIADGWVAYNGEVIKVDAHSIVDQGAGATYFWKLVTTFDPAGLKVFQDASSNDTYQVRRLELTNDVVDTLPGTFFAFDYTTLTSLTLSDLIGRGAWTTIDLNGTANFDGNAGADGTGAVNALNQQPQAGSFFKYQIVGKTVNFQCTLKNFEVNSSLTNSAMVLSNLPFSSKGNQFGIAHVHGVEPAGSGQLTGAHPFRMLDNQNNMVFNLSFGTTGAGAYLAWRYTYKWVDETGDKIVEPTIKDTLNLQYDISFSGTFEIV